jgi:hypothetical protein
MYKAESVAPITALHGKLRICTPQVAFVGNAGEFTLIAIVTLEAADSCNVPNHQQNRKSYDYKYDKSRHLISCWPWIINRGILS